MQNVGTHTSKQNTRSRVHADAGVGAGAARAVAPHTGGGGGTGAGGRCRLDPSTCEGAGEAAMMDATSAAASGGVAGAGLCVWRDGRDGEGAGGLRRLVPRRLALPAPALPVSGREEACSRRPG